MVVGFSIPFSPLRIKDFNSGNNNNNNTNNNSNNDDNNNNNNNTRGDSSVGRLLCVCLAERFAV